MSGTDDRGQAKPGKTPSFEESDVAPPARPRKKAKPPPNIITAGGVDMARGHASGIQVREGAPRRAHQPTSPASSSRWRPTPARSPPTTAPPGRPRSRRGRRPHRRAAPDGALPAPRPRAFRDNTAPTPPPSPPGGPTAGGAEGPPDPRSRARPLRLHPEGKEAPDLDAPRLRRGPPPRAGGRHAHPRALPGRTADRTATAHRSRHPSSVPIEASASAAPPATRPHPVVEAPRPAPPPPTVAPSPPSPPPASHGVAHRPVRTPPPRSPSPRATFTPPFQLPSEKN